ncbi:DUF4238 domain-containing protein [Burkholderia multivorans]|uniref:DUF4238 domain-containing protein n=1 Tax=Burkholderia multivorans TaxID=87883 RepID=UPI002019ED70|nr:DUF4238 domain-containing protein [Burkholderia multivorans]UQN70126.1 DUF4238 domain-containing protein [Burkholderia multivorans]UQN75854.1 DUF4238 domain-containing protein [Burkholderia multivorans]
MSEPKLHHYVPRMYLRNFTNESGKFWVWNKKSGKRYGADPYGVAAENYFYRIPEFIGSTTDPLVLEKAFAKLEGAAGEIIKKCISQLSMLELGGRVILAQEDRHLLAHFIALQFLRTAEQREILALFANESGVYKDELSADKIINLHAYLIYTSKLVEDMTNRLHESIWIFGKNDTQVPFWTSDNPVCFKTGDNRMWLKGPGIMSEGCYAVFPISPSYILYCKEPIYWRALKVFDGTVSPVEFSADMVDHENAGQVFSATRSVISPTNDFVFADEFVVTIGTDIYGPDSESGTPEDEG